MPQGKISYSVYCVILDEFGKILMVRDTYRDKKLSLPGGGMEQGELVTETARREVGEETGKYIEMGKLVGIFSHRKQIGIVLLFTARIIGRWQTESFQEEISWRGFVDVLKHDSSDIYPAQLGMIKQFFEIGENQWPIFDHMIPPLIE